MQKFTITFEYDEAHRKWEVYASGATSPTEAIQGFNAVVITCQEAIPTLEANKATLEADGRYKISVGVVNVLVLPVS